MSEQTYRNPLFGQRVDRYIAPELRQGLGAVLALGDMLNPVSAYRDYLKSAREGDVTGAATNLAGFVAPGAAGAIASRLGRVGIRGVEPYSDDAARALMEMLSPTGAPEVSRGAEGMSRREFLAGLGAAAATPALPVDEMLGGLGRAGARGGVGLSGRLGALAGLRGKINELDEFLEEPRQLRNALNRALQDAEWSPNILMTRDTAEARDKLVRETQGQLDNFNQSYGPMFSERAVTSDMIINGRSDLVSDIARNSDAYADELGDLSDDELRGLADQIEDFMNNPTADLPVYDLVKSDRDEDIVDLFDRNMGGFADRLEAEAARRGLEDVRLYGLREYLDEFSSEVQRVGGVDEFGFVPDDFGVLPRMVGGVEDFGRGLGSVRMPSAEASPGGAIIRPDDLFRGEGTPKITVRQTDQPFVVRGTEQSQIDDMIQSGLVRPKEGGYGKRKLSSIYFGESLEALPTGGMTRPSESRYVLVGDSDRLAGTEGPIPIDHLRHVWVVRNGETVDVLPEILRANRDFGGAQYRPD